MLVDQPYIAPGGADAEREIGGGRDGGNGGPGARRGGSGDVHWARLKDDPSLHLWRADKLSYWLSTCRAAVSKDARMAILAQILRAEPAQTWT